MNTCTHPQPSQRIIRLVRQDVATWCSTCGAIRPIAQDWLLPGSPSTDLGYDDRVKAITEAPVTQMAGLLSHAVNSVRSNKVFTGDEAVMKFVAKIVIGDKPEVVPAPTKPEPQVLCFGCIGVPGHYLYQPNGRSLPLDGQPWGDELDGGLLRGTIPDKIDGQFVTENLDGWTAVSFWDRSGDSRPNSSTTFLINAIIGGDDLLKLARRQWPDLFKRPGFPIK